MDLKDGFTVGDGWYPKTCQQTLHLLDMYTKTSIQKPNTSEGQSFAQKQGKARNGKGNKTDNQDYNKKYWRIRNATAVERLDIRPTIALIKRTTTNRNRRKPEIRA